MQSLAETLKTGPEPLSPAMEHDDAMMNLCESDTHVQLFTELGELPPHSVGGTQEDEKETLGQAGGESTLHPVVPVAVDPCPTAGSLEAVPELKPESASDVGPVEKIEKANGGRRYLSCMKNRRNPLLMDIPEVDSSSLTSSPMSLQCLQCHIIFNNYKSKERHLRSNHPLEYQQSTLKNTLFTCYVCDHNFANSTELMTHQKAHVEKRPYKCPICGQAFYKVSQLTCHKKKHFGEYGYECTTCGKACKTLTLLKYHQRRHTGEKPYACKECGKRFGFPKDVRKHMELHLTREEGEDGANPTPKAQPKIINGAATIIYPCSQCKATFKSTKTRSYHVQKKHKLLLDKARPVPRLIKPIGPIITPISLSQSSFLQVEPLQQVNANIDTEQIRKLIESLENVQKVNQVVILGQVPPYNPMLSLPAPGPAGEVYLNPTPPSLEHSQTEHSSSVEMYQPRETCHFMDQTIILEPITPPNEGLEYPSFQELVSKRRGEVADLQLNPEENVIMELSSALLPVADLENTESIPQQEEPSSTLVPTTELEKSVGKTVIDQDEINPTGQSLGPADVLDKTVETEQEDLHNDPFSLKDTLTQLPYQSPNDPDEAVDSQIQKESVDETQSMMEGMPVEEIDENFENGQTGVEEPEQPESVEKPEQEQVPAEKPSLQEQVPIQLEVKQLESTSDSAVNVMSAQELVKVRKRRPARTFVYEEYIYQQMVSTRKRHLHTGEVSPKRPPTKKGHHVIEFGPKNKEKKSLGQRKRSPQEAKTASKLFFTNMSEKPVAPKKKGRKPKKSNEINVSSAERKSADSDDAQEQQSKNNKTNKLMKKKDVVADNVSKEQDDSAALKKNKIKKVPSPKVSDMTVKERCSKDTAETDPSPQSTEIKVGSMNAPAQETSPDPFLLLKGHKQPQLKVYKLDPSKAAGQTQESTQESTPSPEAHGGADVLSTGVRKRAGRPRKNQKAFSLLSSLAVSDPSPEPAHKPKTTRKRKSSLRIETEGVITACNSKRALECKDCGEKFNSVSSLQEHKTSMHLVESPGLTFTNGNLFEGVSALISPSTDGLIGPVNGPSSWDLEAETREVASGDKECCLSFPALNPSPSLPVEALEASGSEEKTRGASVASIPAFLGVAQQHGEPLSGAPLGKPVNGSPQPDGPQKGDRSSVSGLENPTSSSSEDEGLNRPLHFDCGTEMKLTAEEDVKDEVLLDVDVVTVGEQNEIEQQDFPQCSDVIPNVSGTELVNEKTTEVTLNSSSSSTRSLEFKKEDHVESVAQKRDGCVVRAVGRASGIRGRRRGSLKRGMISRTISDGGNFRGPLENEEPDECKIIFQRCPAIAVSESGNTSSVQRSQCTPRSPQLESNKHTLPAPRAPELGAGPQQETAPSALDTSERITTSRGMGTDDQTQCHLARVPGMVSGQGLDSGGIKVEDSTGGVRPLLVKQGSRLTPGDPPAADGNVIIQWNVETLDSENLPGPEMESQVRSMPPDVHTKQCIFYPVKEEDREVLLCPSQREDGVCASKVSSGAKDLQAEGQPGRYEDNHSTRDHQEPRSEEVFLSTDPNDAGTAEAQGDVEEQDNSHVRVPHFLLQSCDEDDSDYMEYCDPPPAPEARALAYLNTLRTERPLQPTGKNVTTAEIHPEDVRAPIDYFSSYFGWDTWGQIARCTNQLSKMLHLATAKEVAQFVGIHIAMGTLKFPSLKLYWQDLTKVSLIADAMPLPRFLQLGHKLKFALPEKDSTPRMVTQLTSRRPECNLPGAPPTRPSSSGSSGSSSRRGHNSDDDVHNSSQRHGTEASARDDEMSLLWRLQPLLHRFHAGCRLLRPEAEYGVDHFPVPLTTGNINDNVSLHCTVFIGVGGLITKLELGTNPSDKEDVVERMAPRDSVVLLCRQELSTPAMLERLLDAGVHGAAGRVGGAIGQTGDEFVSSDGRLMLRRSKGGFVLSTVGKGEQNVAELMESLERAQTLLCLNRDLRHLYRIPHTLTAPACWPQGVLWFLTDLALVNSWLLYRQGQRTGAEPLTFMAFRLEVSKALIFSSGLETQDSVPPQPPSQSACVLSGTPVPDMRQERSLPDASVRYDGSGHWPEQFEEGEGGRCRFGNCDRTSQVLCLKCCVFLCISRNHNCFMKFHNQQR